MKDNNFISFTDDIWSLTACPRPWLSLTVQFIDKNLHKGMLCSQMFSRSHGGYCQHIQKHVARFRNSKGKSTIFYRIMTGTWKWSWRMWIFPACRSLTLQLGIFSQRCITDRCWKMYQSTSYNVGRGPKEILWHWINTCIPSLQSLIQGEKTSLIHFSCVYMCPSISQSTLKSRQGSQAN